MFQSKPEKRPGPSVVRRCIGGSSLDAYLREAYQMAVTVRDVMIEPIPKAGKMTIPLSLLGM